MQTGGYLGSAHLRHDFVSAQPTPGPCQCDGGEVGDNDHVQHRCENREGASAVGRVPVAERGRKPVGPVEGADAIADPGL